MIISILWQPGPSKGGIQCKQKRIRDRESVRGTRRESKSPHQSHLARGQCPPIQPLQRRSLPRIPPWMTPASWALLAPEPSPVYHEGSYRMTHPPSLIHRAVLSSLSVLLCCLPFALCGVTGSAHSPEPCDQQRHLWTRDGDSFRPSDGITFPTPGRGEHGFQALISLCRHSLQQVPGETALSKSANPCKSGRSGTMAGVPQHPQALSTVTSDTVQ